MSAMVAKFILAKLLGGEEFAFSNAKANDDKQRSQIVKQTFLFIKDPLSTTQGTMQRLDMLK